MKIGIVCNTLKDGSLALKREIKIWYEEHQAEVIEEAKRLHQQRDELDFIIVIGGDGTILSAAGRLYPTPTPLLGINAGRLGFLTAMEKNELIPYFEKTLQKDYKVEHRMMLWVEVRRKEEIIWQQTALNDVVLSRGSLSRILGFNLKVSDHLIGDLYADGFIVATPTGSTAYSLSAGGPILTPQMQAFVLTPICPHTLNVRPMVVSASEDVKIALNEDYDENIVTIDGQRRSRLAMGDELYVRKAEENANIIRFDDRSFFQILGEKIGYQK